jgi:uncharacterized metal-binding protein YceD (DUF177 family)
VTRPEFAVALADLESGPKVVDFTISEAWLRSTLEGTQAEPRSSGRLHAELSKNGKDVLVRGSLSVSVTIPCVVTLDPLTFELEPELSLLLSPDPGAPAAGRQGSATKVAKTPAAPPAPAAAGGKRKKPKKKWGDEAELSESEAGRDTFSGDLVVLDDFVREFILLELPMYPRRSDLPSPGDAASAPAPEPAGSAAIDPRLRPLAEIAKRLASDKRKEKE